MTTLLTMKGFNKTVTPITTAGIYHSPDLGLISLSSDGSNWITIADKNLGATTVYNDGDTLSEANCGNYYQWGNNYGFPFTGAVTTSSSQVDASTYGPGNYYSSSTFITGNNWDSSNNDNLRGDTTDTNIARQGPCANGFHVPSYSDWDNLYNIGESLGARTSTSGNNFKNLLKIPFSGWRQNSSGGAYSAGYYAELMTSSVDGTYCRYIRLYPSDIIINQLTYRTSGNTIRPFANTPVQPDDSRTVLYPTN